MSININTLSATFSTLKRVNNMTVPVLPSFKLNPQRPSNQQVQPEMTPVQYKNFLGLTHSTQKSQNCRYYAVEHKNRIYHIFNAYYYPMGRMINKISSVIRGKESPHYKNNIANVKNGDICVIVNAEDPLFTGKKLLFKNLKYHTGFIGHLKTFSYRQILNKKPQLLYYYMLRKAMPKNKISQKYLENVKIFRGPTHSIPHLLQFAPKPKSFTPLASDIREYLQKMNSDEVKILHESEEGQTEQILGRTFQKQKESDSNINDTLETQDKLEPEKQTKMVYKLSQKQRGKFERRKKKLEERYRIVRAPYRKKKEKIDGLEVYDNEMKARSSPYYEDLANEELDEGEDSIQPDPFKRKGFDKDQ